MFRKKLLAGSVVLMSAFGSAAFAADLPSRKYAPAAPVMPAFSWTGFYVGVNAGAAWTHGSTGLTPFTPGWFNLIDQNGGWRNSNNDVGFTGGGQIGYNHQIGSIVLGAEADFNYIDAETKRSGTANIPLGAFGSLSSSFVARSQVEWFGTLRARVGFTPMDRLMIYGTGGLAYGQVKSSAIETFDFYNAAGGNVFSDRSTGSKSGTRLGWTLGAGAEYALTNNLSLKAEYLYVDLGKQHFNTISSLGDAEVRVDRDTKFSVVRAGINYRF